MPRLNIPPPSRTALIILSAAAAKFVLHLYSAPGYGFFFDELYTIALSQHLAFGYVDLPPLVPALVALSRALLGDSLLALHVFPALAGAITLVFVCLITLEFGGREWAVGLSALAFIASPVWLVLDSIFCYDSIDQMILAAFLFALVRYLRTEDKRLWLWLGGIAGAACMTKVTILFLGPGFLVALLISHRRRDLLTPWPWMGAALFLAIVSPYLIWEATTGWPTLEYWRNYGALRVYHASPAQYLTNVMMYMSPFLLPVWAVGLYRLFRRIGGVRYTFLAVLLLATLILMFFLHAAARMLVELFIPLIAATAVWLEELLAGRSWRRAAQALAAAYLILVGVLVAPLALPILPLDKAYAYADATSGAFPPIKEFNGGSGLILDLLAGRMGWNSLVQTVAEVYHGLPPQERAVAGIYAGVYPNAAAVDVLGPSYGLPHAVSGSLTYYLWGPKYSWEVMLIITNRTNEMAVFFEDCTAGTAVPIENGVPLTQPVVFVCRGPKVPATVLWTSLKQYR